MTELPIVKPKVIAHQVHCVDCPCCGQRNRGELPADVAASWFGPNVISLAGLLMGRFRLSNRQMTQALGECFAIPMAASTVVNQQPVISQALAAPVAELEPVVKNEPVCTIDETGWRQVGAPRRCWLWVVVTAQAPPVSHGTQSDPGSRFVARILTVVETCRQQQRPVVDFLREALTAYRAGQPAPSLLPTHQP